MAKTVLRPDMELGQQVVLAGDGVHLGDLLDPVHDLLGNLLGLAELALDENKDRFHGAAPLVGADGSVLAWPSPLASL